MRFEFSNINELWGTLVVEELVRAGVTCFCICSGSRSTPLTLAAANNKRAITVVHFDERGAAFYALGYARATGIPAAVICTSGTAAANLIPAVVEASVDNVPMIVLSADRPPELRQTGANQTIDQVKLFGEYVRFEMDMPCPDEKIPAEFVLTSVDQGVYRAVRLDAGPVHFNFMFREPLAPENKKEDFGGNLHNLLRWGKSESQFTDYPEAQKAVSDKALRQIASVINKSKSGIIVCGKAGSRDSVAVMKLAEKIGWPVFPDIGSGLRLGVKSSSVVPYFDQVLLGCSSEKTKPDCVIHFGGQLVSKRLGEYLENVRPGNYIRVANNPRRLDPNHQVTKRLECEISIFCDSLVSKLTKKNTSALLEILSRQSSNVNKTLSDALAAGKNLRGVLSEPAVVRIISEQISKSGALFLASSLPVREMDMFASSAGINVPAEYNRGASGIDGTIASAVGYANGVKKTVTLLIGDLGFLHDLNSLALVKKSEYPVILVILNNDGGGIFSFLPVTQANKQFETYFGTPHGLSFKKSAEQFEILYYHPKTAGEFSQVYAESQKKNRCAIIEVTTNRKANWELHQNIGKAVKNALAKK